MKRFLRYTIYSRLIYGIINLGLSTGSALAGGDISSLINAEDDAAEMRDNSINYTKPLPASDVKTDIN